MNIVETKALIGFLFGIVRLLFGLLPIKLRKYFKKHDVQEDGANFVNARREQQIRCFLAMFQSFSGGVLFATCFLHMMHELYFSLTPLLREANMSDRYPFNQLIVSFGFFLVYFIEEAASWFISRIPDEGACQRSASRVQPDVDDEPSCPVYTIADMKIEDCAPETPEKKPPTPSDDGHNNNVNATDEKTNELNLEAVAAKDTAEHILQLEQFIEKKNRTQQQLMRGVIVILALCVHAFFEGLAIGLQVSLSNIIYLFVAISIHSATILFCMSLEMLLAHRSVRTIIIHVLILSVSSPVGVFLGLAMSLHVDSDNITHSHNVAVVILEGLSTGTILYITFFEVLQREKERREYRIRRALCILAGFAFMSVLEIFEL